MQEIQGLQRAERVGFEFAFCCIWYDFMCHLMFFRPLFFNRFMLFNEIKCLCQILHNSAKKVLARVKIWV